MDPNIILRIIELSLQIWLEVLRTMPDSDKAAAWQRYETFVAFWQKLIPAPADH